MTTRSRRAELRQQIADLGGPTPPRSANLAELQARLDGLTDGTDSADTDSSPADRPAGPPSWHRNPPAKCPAGRPLYTSTLCDRCFLAGAACEAG